MWRKAISGPVPLLIASSLLLAIIGLTGFFVAAQEQTATQLLKAVDASNTLPKLLSALQEAETGQRGFLLTGRDSYLSPFLSATDRLPVEIRRLEHSTSIAPRALRGWRR